MSAARPVLIAAGGTGGHVVPGLAVAEALRERRVPVVWAGTANGLESRLVPAAGISLSLIDIRGLRGQSLIDTALGPVRLLRAVFQSLSLLREQRVSAVLGMGGFVSGPVAIAALLLRIPLVLHEQNAVPGMTNVWLARFAKRVFSAFPDAFAASRSVEVVGNPVPESIVSTEQDQRATESAPLSVLVIGGSRGAEFLNRIVPAALAHRRSAAASDSLVMVHQAGSGRGDATRARYTDTSDQIEVSDFIDDMASAYHQADLVISRAGAMTVTELAASGTPALLVPYPHAVDDHQTANGSWLASVGAAVVLQEAELDAARLASEIERLVSDRPALSAMAQAARQRFVAGAAVRVANALIDVSGQRPVIAGNPTPGSQDDNDVTHRRQPMKGQAVTGGSV